MTLPRAARSAVRAASAAVLLATLTGCGLAAELEREANPARTPEPRATATPLPPGPSPSADHSAPSPPPVPTGCPESGLRATTAPVDAAMGLRATSITLTNCGATPTTVNGYPALTVLDEDREPLDVEVLQGTEGITAGLGGPTAPVPVTLAPGESARAGIAWRNTVTDATVRAVHAPSLSVAPSPGEPAQVVPVEGGLDLGTTGRLGTTPWHRTEG